jgi:hypothetical protein
MEVKLYHCYKCEQYKTATNFSKDKSRRSGLGSKCKSCDIKRLKNCGRSELGKLSQKLKGKLRKRIRDTLKGLRPSNGDIGCSGLELISHIESQWEVSMSWDNYGEGFGNWVIDHKRPISNFLKCGDDVRKANHYTNLGPLWWVDNQYKSDKF